MPLYFSAFALLLSAVSFVISVKAMRKPVDQSSAVLKKQLGHSYAELAWGYARSKKGSPDELRRHAVGAFILADTSADGKRDFTDAQVAVYLDGAQ